VQSADFSTDDLLAFLNRSWTTAGNESNTLGPQLLADQQAAVNFIAPVGSLSHVSKNSTSQGYGGFNPGNLTIRQITAIYTRLLRDFNATLSDITKKAVTAGCTITSYDFDNDVYNAMVSHYNAQSVENSRPDITNLDFGGVGRCPEGIWAW
jgi:hypothetical protein